MYINYKGKNYYWNTEQFKENLKQTGLFAGAILCYIIGCIVENVL